MLAERSKRGVITDDEEGTNRRDLPDDEFKDFLGTYEDVKWWIEKKMPVKTKPNLTARETEEIKEEDEGKEGSDSEENKEEKKEGSPLIALSHDSAYASNRGGDEEDEDGAWPSLDEALAKEFDINEVSTLKQRFNDVQR